MTMFSRFISKVVGPTGDWRETGAREAASRGTIAPRSMRWSGT